MGSLRSMHLRPEAPGDRLAADELIARAFGPDRYAKAAERLREGGAPRLDLSVTAWDGERLAGVLRLWPISVGGAPALLLGPIAVDADHRGRGLAVAMAAETCRLAQAAGERLVLLVGEERLFAPLGFVRVEPGRVTLPGPLDPLRLFVLELQPGAFERVEGRAEVRRPSVDAERRGG